VDLGEGGQGHNQRLDCQIADEGTMHIYSSTLRSVKLNLFFWNHPGGPLGRPAHSVGLKYKSAQQYLVSISNLEAAIPPVLFGIWRTNVDLKFGRKHVQCY